MGSEKAKIKQNLERKYSKLESTLSEAKHILEEYNKIDSPLFWSESSRYLKQLHEAVAVGKKDSELIRYVGKIETNCKILLGDISKIEKATKEMYGQLFSALRLLPAEQETIRFFGGDFSELSERSKSLESEIKDVLPKMDRFHRLIPTFLGRLQTLKSYRNALRDF